MQYMMLIYQGSTPRPGVPGWEELSQEEQGQIYQEYRALNETPGVTPGNSMEEPDTATTVRVENGETLVTDGPYAEVKDVIGGYAVLDVEDLDAAIAIAVTVPAASRGGGIEIRPIRVWNA